MDSKFQNWRLEAHDPIFAVRAIVNSTSLGMIEKEFARHVKTRVINEQAELNL